MSARILVVDDELAITKLVTYHLERDGFTVTPRYDGESAYNEIMSGDFDLVVLDIMLPRMSGWDVLRLARNAGKRFPVILLTARTDEVDKVAGLELGADDYVTKPFSPRELVARVRAHLRRRQESQTTSENQRLTVGSLTIDQGTRDVTLDGSPLSLTAKEFDLLAHLAKKPGWTFTRDDLLESVWGYEFAGDTRTVDVHVSRVRQKLDRMSKAREAPTIETMRGVGYKLAMRENGDRY